MAYIEPVKPGKPGSHSEFMRLNPDTEAPRNGSDTGFYRAALSDGEEAIAAVISQEASVCRMCADFTGLAVCNCLAKRIARRTVSPNVHMVFMGACGFPGDVV